MFSRIVGNRLHYRFCSALPMAVLGLASLGMSPSAHAQTPQEEADAWRSTPIQKPRASKKKTNARSLARKMEDDVECLRAIKNLAYRSEKAAFVLLRACAEQGKFRRLSFLLKPPYLDFTKAMKRGMRLRFLARILAVRGADFRNDTAALARVGIRLPAIKEALEKPNVYLGKPVIFLGETTKSAQSGSGVYMYEINELRSATTDRKGDLYVRTDDGRLIHRASNVKIGSYDQRIQSGWLITGRSRKPVRNSDASTEMVFLAVFRGVISADDQLAKVTLLEAYPAA